MVDWGNWDDGAMGRWHEFGRRVSRLGRQYGWSVKLVAFSSSEKTSVFIFLADLGFLFLLCQLES